MIIKEMVERFGMEVKGGAGGLGRQIDTGYSGDLLSEIMGNAPENCVWLTVQSHLNIVAVAVLKEMAGIVLTSGQAPDQETVEKADAEGIPLLMYNGSAFALAGELYKAGIVSAL
ncbi:hypothetical protein QUF70_14025 [Desulfobacterales bacterium HSG17]|nr:hypothetical protein [Desulfobacterales bacterium HSG17]